MKNRLQGFIAGMIVAAMAALGVGLISHHTAPAPARTDATCGALLPYYPQGSFLREITLRHCGFPPESDRCDVTPPLACPDPE